MSPHPPIDDVINELDAALDALSNVMSSLGRTCPSDQDRAAYASALALLRKHGKDPADMAGGMRRRMGNG